MRFASVFLLCTLLWAEPRKLLQPYQSILDLAQSTPPEFAADALLRVVESGKIADRDAKRDLVEQAFRLAGAAKFPLRMRGIPGSMVDTRSGYMSKAYDLKLDALSLQSRAVRDMLPIDKTKARELFFAIPKPVLQPLTCDDPLFYQVDDYYQALGLVVDGAFTDKERAKEEHVNFLLDYLSQAMSPLQLAPLARVIKSAGITPAQREILWNRLGGMLENLQADDRSFSASVADLSLMVPAELRPTFEKFQQRSTGCKDDAQTSALFGATPASTTPKVDRYWQSVATHMLLEGGKKLRFGPEGSVLTDADRATREWQQQLTDYLNQLADWGPSQEKSEADYYHQKCVIYEALIELIPASPERDKTLQSYLSFVANSNLQQDSPVEWFMHVHSMLERVRATRSGEPVKMLNAFQNSGNPVLALYATLEKTFGASAPAWVTAN